MSQCQRRGNSQPESRSRRGAGVVVVDIGRPYAGLTDAALRGIGLPAAFGAIPSWSSVSAAIQPDISTIGMPGPGWAAPPARYSPFTSRERLAGLNAPVHLPWLASP